MGYTIINNTVPVKHFSPGSGMSTFSSYFIVYFPGRWVNEVSSQRRSPSFKAFMTSCSLLVVLPFRVDISNLIEEDNESYIQLTGVPCIPCHRCSHKRAMNLNSEYLEIISTYIPSLLWKENDFHRNQKNQIFDACFEYLQVACGAACGRYSLVSTPIHRASSGRVSQRLQIASTNSAA